MMRFIVVLMLILYGLSTQYAHSQTSGQVLAEAIDELQTGQHESAYEKCSRVIQVDPRNAGAYYIRGLIRGEIGDDLRAIQDYNQSLRLNSKDAAVWYARGNSKSRLSDYRGAIDDFTQAVNIGGSYKDVCYMNRGNCYSALENFKSALLDYNQALILNPSCADCLQNRAWAKHNLNDKEGACRDWSKAGEMGVFKAYNFIKNYCR